jgi:hypothetical protein
MSSQVHALARPWWEGEDACGWGSGVDAGGVIIPVSASTLATWLTSTIDRSGGVGVQWASGGIV